MEDFLTVRQVAILLKVHHLTVRRYINEGKLKAVRIGGNIRVSQHDLQTFSEVYTPHAKSAKISTRLNPVSPFSSSDPLFRLKGRGLSMNNPDNI